MKTCSSRTLSPARERQSKAGVVPAALVAHGLNNTLTVITGFSELLLGVMSECDPHRRYVEEIQRAGSVPPKAVKHVLRTAATLRKSSAPASTRRS
jgi:hypothetical protein